MAQSFEKEILEIKKVYSKISYDLSKIKSIPKIYDAYKIKNDEKIIAFAKSSAFLMPLTMSGVIITDKALYINPFNGSLVNENALPFEELCSYVISLPDEKSALDLVGIGIQKEIWGNILGRNVIGGELQSFLLALQEKLSGKYSWAIEQQNKLLDKAINNNAIEIQTCSLSRETKYIFDYFIQKKQYSDKVAPFVVERIYRKRGMADAKEFISILDGSVSPTGINSLHANLPLLEKNFLKDISNISLSFDREYVIKLLENPQLYICSDDTSTFKFEAYLSARLGDVERFKKAQNIILQASGNTEAFKLEHFICLSLNKLMQSVYDSISKNQMPSAHLLKIKDNFGFDALHYAIILGKESIIDKLLDTEIYATNDFSADANLTENILNYGVLAELCNYDKAFTVSYKTSEFILSQQKTLKVMERRLKARQVQVAIQRKAESMYSQGMSQASRTQNREMYNDCKEKHYNAKQLIKDTEEIIRDIEAEISEFKNELFSYIQSIKTEIRSFISQLSDCNNEYISLVLNLIKKPQDFISILNSDDSKLYIYDNISFVLFDGMIVNIPYMDMSLNNPTEDFDDFWKEKEPEAGEFEKEDIEEYVSTKRPYGDSWFSPKAHSDEGILKREYRKLAKMYHPDVNKTKESKIIFQEISNERADILDSFE